jgi:hypothetical protein
VGLRRGRCRRRTDLAAFESKYGERVTSPDGTWHGLGDAIRTGDVLLFRIDPALGFAFGKGETFSPTRYAFHGET